MLNMGFGRILRRFCSYVPNEDRQTILFSATMPQPILDITQNYQKTRCENDKGSEKRT